ncbi:MAG TPA: hypothetical protein VIG33_14730 [Pseudobdellovibrionaceae bacterium]|jgi:hypothetical protein
MKKVDFKLKSREKPAPINSHYSIPMTAELKAKLYKLPPERNKILRECAEMLVKENEDSV